MVIPHISVQPICHSKSRNHSTAAAHGAAEKIADLGIGKTAHFACKQGVVHTEMLASEGAAS